MNKDYIIKVLTTSLENKRKAKPEIDRLLKAYKEVQGEKNKAIVRVSESFDTDLNEIRTAVEVISEECGIPLSIGEYTDKERYLPDVLHNELSRFDYKMANIKKECSGLTISDEAIIDMFANEFGDVLQYWNPSNCY